VRTKFSNYRSDGECEEDKKALREESEKIAKLCKSIVYVDNPPINIFVDEDDDKTIEINC